MDNGENDNVRRLRTRPMEIAEKVNQDCVKLLEQALEIVREGEVQHVAVLMDVGDGFLVNHGWNDPDRLIGMLMTAAHDIMHKRDEG